MIGDTGATWDIAIEDWHRPADELELGLLAALETPVLEVGCGPGRLVAALAATGRPALGIDLAPLAADLAAGSGAAFLARSVFDLLPGEGRWPTVLVVDGSVGIGGDPLALLRRLRQLLGPGGVAVVEVDGPAIPTRHATVRIVPAHGMTAWLPWATVGCDDITALAGQARLAVRRLGPVGGRWFAWLASAA